MRYLLAAILLISCSPQKRLNRILHKHPELTNTRVHTDTVLISTVQYDTVLRISQYDSTRTDTFVIEKPRFITRIIRHGNDLAVSTKVRDTVRLVQTITKTITRTEKLPWWQKLIHAPLLLFTILSATFIAISILRNR